MVEKCINNAVRQNFIDAADGQKLINDFRAASQAHMAGGAMNPQAAASLAQRTLVGQLRNNASIKAFRAALQMKAHANLAAHIANADDVMKAVNAIFTPDWRDRYTFNSLEYRSRYIEAQAKKFYSEAIANLPRKFKGEVLESTQKNIYSEMVGISTGDKWAKAFADGVRQSLDYVSDRFALAGGAIGKRGNYDLQHIHSSVKVGEVPKAEWVAFVKPLLDRSKMIDDYTGLPMSDPKLNAVLDAMYETIATNGYNKKSTTFQGKASTANKYDNERVLHFAGDGWFSYNERFGERDIVSTAIKQITNMSREIAQMETFGPNVAQGIEHLKATAIRTIQNERVGKPISDVKGLIKVENNIAQHIDEWVDIANGRAFGAINQTNAKYWDNARGIIASAQLGSALLSATGDFGTLAWTAGFNDMPIVQVMKNYLDGLFSGKSADEIKVFAAGLGLQVEHLQANILAEATYGVAEAKGLGTVMADKVLRWSGLTRHTDAGRVAFSVTMAQTLAKSFNKTFDQLDNGLQRGLKINGVSAAEWDIIRQSPTLNRNGIPHINLAALERMEATLPGAAEAAVKVGQYINAETDKAIITAGWKFERTFADAHLKGQIGRTVSMYKRYPILLIYSHLGRMLSVENSFSQGAGYAAGFTLSMTLLGGIALTLKDISAGRDPRSWDTPGFWMDAFFQGGAGGIIGDYLKTSIDSVRQKRSSDAVTPFLNATIGPMVQLTNDVLRPSWSFFNAMANGKPYDKMWKSAFSENRNLLKYIPGNNIWYGRLAFDRLVEDAVTKAITPNANEIFSRQIENRKKYYGQKFWWRPGRNAPDRGPDFGSNG
jgi:hypothetical protein